MKALIKEVRKLRKLFERLDEETRKANKKNKKRIEKENKKANKKEIKKVKYSTSTECAR